MSGMLDENSWNLLLQRINDGKCTPFIGAGTCYGVLPLGAEIARHLAQKYEYPLDDAADLMRVAQFLALEFKDAVFPKDEVLKLFDNKAPDFSDPYEPHRVLANLPLPVYLTTNYDDFMTRALQLRKKEPKREMCQWNEYIRGYPTIFKTNPDYKPSPANPVVFHLHGHSGMADSLVLTEDDYLDFLVNSAREPGVLPPVIRSALAGTSLLFIGYRIADWNLRTILRGLSRLEQSGRRISIATMLLPVDETYPEEQKKAQEHLTKYYGNINVLVYWGPARDFLKELGTRWQKFSQEL